MRIYGVYYLGTFKMWIHNISFGLFGPLNMDQSLITAVIFCFGLPLFWGQNQPSKFKLYYTPLSVFVKICSLLVIAFGLASLYKINYVLILVKLVNCIRCTAVAEDHSIVFQAQSENEVKIDNNDETKNRQ